MVAKYPKEQGYRLFWIFDQSSCHTAYAADALNANKMNARPGGQQLLMRNTVEGKVSVTDKAGHCTWTFTKDCKRTD